MLPPLIKKTIGDSEYRYSLIGYRGKVIYHWNTIEISPFHINEYSLNLPFNEYSSDKFWDFDMTSEQIGANCSFMYCTVYIGT